MVRLHLAEYGSVIKTLEMVGIAASSFTSGPRPTPWTATPASAAVAVAVTGATPQLPRSDLLCAVT